MRKNKKLALVVASLFLATLWGCGSNMDSGGDQSSPGSTIPDAAKLGSDSCKICHTTIAVTENFNGSVHDNDSVAGCEGCHGGGQYHKGVGPIPYPSPTLAAQCSTCHTDAGFLARHAGDLVTTSYQTTPSTPTVEGYVLSAPESAGCVGCHGNIHNPVAIEINKAWANSAHAGRIASTSPDTESVWGHYDWDAANRASCARCHTATGAMNFLNAPFAYNAANNNFSHLEGWTATTSSQQNELLYCWGCHSDVANGTLRNPGPITETYTAATTGAPATTVVYPDAFASNVCMGCHLGREVGDNIVNDTDADGVRGFINSHYLAAGGMIYAKAGYEYAGQDYTNSFDGHAVAGSTDGNGPCVTCHMTSGEAHKFEVVTKDTTGIITAISTTACDSCHGNMNAAWLEERKETFHEALEALNQALVAKGIEFKPAHPYFYIPGTSTAFTNWAGVYGLASWKDVMGAAFNYNLIEHDPGAYTHNRSYALKLIADSIDFLADGVVNGVGIFTINAAPVDLLATVMAVEGTTIDAKHFGGTVGVKAQYVAPVTSIKPAGGACTDCHAGGSTAANGVIIDQFAESAHGDVNGEAWLHYDWRFVSTSPSTNRAACARCHNATAYVAKLGIESDESGIYNGSSDNDLAGEVLSCAACHTDIATGAVRTATAYTATYSNGATQSFPNVGASNLCVRCHGARESGDSIKLSTGDFTNLNFINSHYLAAGATVFAGGGYEFTGQNYVNPNFFQHDVVGIANAAAPAASDAGPCVGCHMGTSANHTWEVVAKNSEGVITAINSEVCANCHAGSFSTTPEKLELAKENLHASLAALEAAMAAKGIYFYPAYPYFFTSPYIVGGTNTAFKNWESVYPGKGKDVMGAAFNYNLLEHDPGAYAHNRVYTRRLIFDSIDFLDNGILNGTISVTGEAATYLGTTRL